MHGWREARAVHRAFPDRGRAELWNAPWSKGTLQKSLRPRPGRLQAMHSKSNPMHNELGVATVMRSDGFQELRGKTERTWRDAGNVEQAARGPGLSATTGGKRWRGREGGGEGGRGGDIIDGESEGLGSVDSPAPRRSGHGGRSWNHVCASKQQQQRSDILIV